MTAQDILENNLTVFEPKDDTVKQSLGPFTDLDLTCEMGFYLEEQIEPDDYFENEYDPAGGRGLESHR